MVALSSCGDGSPVDDSRVAAGETLVSISIEAVSAASEWPVGGEWRLSQPWASPQELWESQYRLWQDAIVACVDAAGFEYRPALYVDSDLVFRSMNPLNEAVWGVFGYAEPPSPDPSQPQTENSDAFYASVSECADRGSEYVYGTETVSKLSQAQQAAVNSVDNAVFGYSSSTEGARTLQRWSDCMAAAGYEYTSPSQARSELSRDPMNDVALDVRRTDFECDVQVELTQSRSKWESARLNSWLDEHALEIDEINQLILASGLETAELAEKLATDGYAALPEANLSSDVIVSASSLP